MSAKNGWMRSFRLLGCLMAVCLVGSAVLASVASAKKPPLNPTSYIALGDSLSFGYKEATKAADETTNKAHCEAGATAAENGETELAVAEKALCVPPSTFEGGFVGYFAKKLAKTEKEAGNALATVNLGCPGETSDGLIGHTFGKAGPEYNPCGYHNVLSFPGSKNPSGFPLKTEIGGSSELEAAANMIATKSAGEIKAISLQIGSNDELFVVAECENATYDGEHGFGSLTACLEHEVGPEGYTFEGGVFHHVLANIGQTIGVLRGAGYEGKIIVIGFYNPDATILAGSNTLEKILNESLEGLVAKGEYGPEVVVAQPFAVLNPEAALFKPGEETAKETEKKQKKETAAICKYTEMCNTITHKVPTASGDIHPTKAGYTAIGKLMVAAF